MSIELPEIEILSSQMNHVLRGKEITEIKLDNYEKLQRSKFFNLDISEYDNLKYAKIESVTGRGTVIRVKLNNKMNLLLAPEMGGELRYHEVDENLPKKFHLIIDFTDSTKFSTRLKGYGLIYASYDEDLSAVYSYNRDFLHGVSPLEDEYTLDYVENALKEKDKNLKTLMVGKDAIVVGYGNAGFQEIAYQAGIHPKRKSSTFTRADIKSLFQAIKTITKSRLDSGGKDSFTDLFGIKGKHTPLVGGHLRDKPCPKCGTIIERLMFGGGPTYLCSKCQI